jgi:hypothetical protein
MCDDHLPTNAGLLFCPSPPAERGASGVEFAGYSNDLTTLADARTDQSAQAIAYPYNIIRPQNTLTCTQVSPQACWVVITGFKA